MSGRWRSGSFSAQGETAYPLPYLFMVSEDGCVRLRDDAEGERNEASQSHDGDQYTLQARSLVNTPLCSTSARRAPTKTPEAVPVQAACAPPVPRPSRPPDAMTSSFALA